VTFSSDMVFDGKKGEAYVEWDAPNPINNYGRSKAEGERRVLAAGGKVLIIRTATFFSPHDAGNVAVEILDELGHGRLPSAATDIFMSPTFVPDLVDAVLDLLIDGETGIWHISNPACLSWFEFAQMLARKAGFDPEMVVGMTAEELGWRAPRPRQVTLGSVRGAMLSEVEPAVERFLGDTYIAAHREEPKAEPATRDPVLQTAVPAE
jgi:dTDP-4-dehydrorhamnose reductase